ncbi:ELMO domain-containing protein A [Panicum miliaceum]|uniref:ELMO domain-containing protein A n=1 Tax=Panicum miliaceum TaxID=4540 RepID=A0A3L6SAL8_PANMI|nr:ELMO domain-containing protein A [Panicum miliaceum]
MSISNLRRRLHHGDVDGRKNEHVDISSADALNEPLLGSSNDNGGSEVYDPRRQDLWDDDRKKEQLHWSFLFSNLIAQWAQWLANILVGSGSIFGRLFPFSLDNQSSPVYLSPLQEERLNTLRRRLQIPFDGSRIEHQDALRQLWRLAYPTREIPPLKSELWKEMGWQGTDPSTDFRGGGLISLENLIFFAKNYPNSFQMLLNKVQGQRSDWEYPFAVAGINISFMLIQMLDLQSTVPSSKSGIRFLELLGRDESAFDHLYCLAFRLLDAQWLVKRASYMEFNEVMKSTRTQLERELVLEDVLAVKDLPSCPLPLPQREAAAACGRWPALLLSAAAMELYFSSLEDSIGLQGLPQPEPQKAPALPATSVGRVKGAGLVVLNCAALVLVAR